MLVHATNNSDGRQTTQESQDQQDFIPGEDAFFSLSGMAVETDTDVFGSGFLAGTIHAYKKLAGDKSKNNVNFKMIAPKELEMQKKWQLCAT